MNFHHCRSLVFLNTGFDNGYPENKLHLISLFGLMLQITHIFSPNLYDGPPTYKSVHVSYIHLFS